MSSATAGRKTLFLFMFSNNTLRTFTKENDGKPNNKRTEMEKSKCFAKFEN